jgi:N-methylhydantoinase B
MTGGGGGFGAAGERDRELIRSDVRNRHVSAEAARTSYGIDLEE